MSQNQSLSSPSIPKRPQPASMVGCPVHRLKDKLREAGLRPTRQRVVLGWLLLGKGDRHVTAESLYEEASRLPSPVSLATVYNTLHQFTEAGLLREIALDGAKSWFDTNTSNHHHFLNSETGELKDIFGAEVALNNLPAVPDGMEIDRVDVVVRLRKVQQKASQV